MAKDFQGEGEMIVSTNGDSRRQEFETLLNGSIKSLRSEAKRFKYRSPIVFEQDVKDVMDDAAKGTAFQGTLVLKSGGAFPDIYTNRPKYPFGVEVKTTKQDQWRTVGNSVLESTRIEGIEHIYVLFGKLAPPVGFIYKKYEECIYGVAVTHSPRYLIDMRLNSGETVFDKMRMPYDELRKKPDPISPLKKYYRTTLRPGESLWWLETPGDEPPMANVKIRLWQSLETSEREVFVCHAMALFPRIFREGDQLKFSELAVWLINKHSVINTSLRDPFTAGGQVTIKVGCTVYRGIPRIFENLRIRIPAIHGYLTDADNLPEIEDCWERDVNLREVFPTWIHLVEENCRAVLEASGFPLREMIQENLT